MVLLCDYLYGRSKLTVLLLHRIATDAWPKFGQTPWYIMAVVIVFSTPVQAGEEVGWRGYALPLMTKRLGLARASIVLGVIWAAWHLPFFFIPRSDNAGQSFPVYLLAVTALSVAMAWLYWRTNGSLLLTMLMHSAINNTASIVSSPASAATNPFTLRPSFTAWLTAGVLWICAAFFLWRMPKADQVGCGPTIQSARCRE
jgi:membrane protease YdiL (CAAX protease family)